VPVVVVVEVSRQRGRHKQVEKSNCAVCRRRRRDTQTFLVDARERRSRVEWTTRQQQHLARGRSRYYYYFLFPPKKNLFLPLTPVRSLNSSGLIQCVS